MIELPYSSSKEFPVSGFLQYYECEKTVYNYRSAIQRYLNITKRSDLTYDQDSLDRVAVYPPADSLAVLESGAVSGIVPGNIG